VLLTGSGTVRRSFGIYCFGSWNLFFDLVQDGELARQTFGGLVEPFRISDL
jgi:hypothetical protein